MECQFLIQSQTKQPFGELQLVVDTFAIIRQTYIRSERVISEVLNNLQYFLNTKAQTSYDCQEDWEVYIEKFIDRVVDVLNEACTDAIYECTARRLPNQFAFYFKFSRTIQPYCLSIFTSRKCDAQLEQFQQDSEQMQSMTLR